MVSGRLPLAELKRHEMTDALTKGSLDMPLICGRFHGLVGTEESIGTPQVWRAGGMNQRSTVELELRRLPPEDWPPGYMIGVRSLAEACRKFDPQDTQC